MFFLFLYLIFTKQNAVILILCRNTDKEEIIKTLENFENKFNNNFKYPYVFLNDELFTDDFKSSLNKVVDNAEYGLIDDYMWSKPNVDWNSAKEHWAKLKSEGVPYADTKSYHNMCRFYSGFFYKHNLVQKYEYYWRIEPGVRFRCNITEDPFDYLKDNNKLYGFVITLKEYMASIKTLYDTVKEFIILNRNIIKDKNNLKFMFEIDNYNGCHFWSNFEIANFSIFRSELYEKYFNYLDSKNGFYYERWGDAPVHSLFAALFLDKKEIHFFKDIGYTHEPFTHCPNKESCDCKQDENFDMQPFSCLPNYLKEL